MSAILMAPFFASASEPVGQQVWVNDSSSAATYTFVVPDGATSVWALLVSPGFGASSDISGTNIKRGSTVLLAGDTTIGSGVGGGNGGFCASGGAGGAGGYSGNGGNPGGSGSGGGGGGASGSGSTGGGVGLLGEGPSGSSGGGDGSVQFGNEAFGAGRAASGTGRYAGNLRYTELTVTPGESLTISIAGRTFAVRKTSGAVRIMWGGGRSYPNNAADM